MKKNSNSLVKIVAVFIVIITVITTASSCSKNAATSSSKNYDTVKTDLLTRPTAKSTTTPSEITLELAKAAYQNKFNERVAENAESFWADNLSYSIYDIDGNGIPELIIDNGYKTNTMEDGIEIYTYTENDGLILIGSSYDGWTNAFYDEIPNDGKINVVFVAKGKCYINEYCISNNTLTVTPVVEMHDYNEEDRQWLDSLEGIIEFIYYELEAEATTEPTTSLYDYYDSQIVTESRFNSIEELTEHYLNYWEINHGDLQACKVIEAVDWYNGEGQKELITAAAVTFLAENNKSVLDFEDELLYIQICNFLPFSDFGNATELPEIKRLMDLFTDDVPFWMVIKAYYSLANEATLLNALENGEKVIKVQNGEQDNGTYATKKVAQYAHDSLGNYCDFYEYFGIENTTGAEGRWDTGNKYE